MREYVIGFLGAGNIGGSVWNLLEGFKNEVAHRGDIQIRIKKILVRDLGKPRAVNIPRDILTTDPSDVLDDPEITLIAEFMGGIQPATDYMLRAMRNGKAVVTANKAAIALNWHLLNAAAEINHTGLYFEASVCGAVPVISALSRSLQANHITKLMGIVNGTTNYILSHMSEQGEAYETVLADAQTLGLAEPDPSSDVEGLDAAYKISILSSLAFHAHVSFSDVYVEGITHITPLDISLGKEMGYTLKLLAIAKRDGHCVEVRVHPTFVPNEHPIASVSGSYNALYVIGHACREMMFQGRGAGGLPTASAVVSDILNAVTLDKHHLPTFKISAESSPELRFTDNWECPFFIRMAAIDAPGVLSKVAACFASENVSIASMIQKDYVSGGRVPLIFITHKAYEISMRKAISRLDPDVCTVESMIRVEI